MPLTTKTFDQIVSDLCTAWAAEISLSPALVAGDPVLALMKAVGSQGLYLQFLVNLIYKFARASTAEGSDLDSWMADFGFARLAATYSTGKVTLSTKVAKPTTVVVPLGKTVQVNGGAIKFDIVADTNLTAWSPNQNSYVMPPGTLSIDVAVKAQVAGSSSNVQALQINQIANAITGIDTVANAQPLISGLDAESDKDYRARFILWINSLSKATKAALLSTILNVQQGLNVALLENTDVNANPRNGFFTAVIDDGSGATPGSLLTTIYNSLDAVRGFTIQHAVLAAVKVTVTIALNIKVATGANAVETQLAVQNAILNYVNTLKIGETLYLHKVTQIAIDASPNVLSVQPNSQLIDATEADRTCTVLQVIRTDAAHVTAGTY